MKKIFVKENLYELGIIVLAYIVFKLFRMLGRKYGINFTAAGIIMFVLVVLIGSTYVNISLFRQKKIKGWEFVYPIGINVIFIWLFFSMAYTIIPPTEQGYISVNGDAKSLSIQDGLYFSAVTMTTLGYGDMAPNGFFRAFAVTESFLGLLFFALFISGLTHVAIKQK